MPTLHIWIKILREMRTTRRPVKNKNLSGLNNENLSSQWEEASVYHWLICTIDCFIPSLLVRFVRFDQSTQVWLGQFWLSWVCLVLVRLGWFGKLWLGQLGLVSQQPYSGIFKPKQWYIAAEGTKYLLYVPYFLWLIFNQ